MSHTLSDIAEQLAEQLSEKIAEKERMQNSAAAPSSPILTQKDLEQKKETESKEMQQELKIIAEMVNTVFHFGSPNHIRDQNPKFEDAFNDFFKKVASYYAFLFSIPEKESIQSKEDREKLWAFFKSQGHFFGFSFDELTKYFSYNPKAGRRVMMNPTATLRVIKYYKNLMQLGKLEPNEIKSLEENMTIISKDKTCLLKMMALQALEFQRDAKEKNQIDKFIGLKTKLNPTEFKNSLILGMNLTLHKEQEPKTQAECRAVLLYMVRDVLFSGYIQGTGNCQILAETAFLLALLKIKNIPLYYVKFIDKTGETEELNGIAVGPWPSAGCKVLIPWGNQKPFDWKGSFKSTQELNDYNEYHILFSVKTEEKRAQYAKDIVEWGFDHEKQLQNPNRLKNTKYVESIAEKVYQALLIKESAAPHP